MDTKSTTTTNNTADALAAAEDLQAFVDRIAYVRCHMAAGEQTTFDKLTGYPYRSGREIAADSRWRFENETVFHEEVLQAATKACGKVLPCEPCIEHAIVVVIEKERAETDPRNEEGA